MTPDQRFDVKWVLDHETGCHEWTASKDRYGYGRFGFNGKQPSAHRWAYERVNGTIPEGLVIDHLCRNRGCVNPDHLEAVEQVENMRRARGYGKPKPLGPSLPHISVIRKNLTHCIWGHEFTPENTRRNRNGTRRCVACVKRRNGARHASA
jgi:hypothetical protein